MVSIYYIRSHIKVVTTVVQQKQTRLVSMRMWFLSLALLSGSGICHCCGCGVGWELWLQSTTSLGTSICCGCNSKKQKKLLESQNNDLGIEGIQIIQWYKIIVYGRKGFSEHPLSDWRQNLWEWFFGAAFSARKKT